ncbi:pilus assembly protein PilM [Candidatus Omnitrophota bacterium]
MSLRAKDGAIVKHGEFLIIEIGDQELKVAVCKLTQDKFDILAVTAVDIAKSSEEDIAGKIKEFASEHRLRKIETINIIPTQYAISKNIEIPSVNQKEIKEIIDLQAGRHTPYSREEIIMDYMDIGVFHERYTKILLVIVKKDVITKRYEIIKKAGFTASRAVLATEPISILCSKSLPADLKGKSIAIVHVDRFHFDFTVVSVGKIIYTRSIPQSGLDGSSLSEETKQNFLNELKKSIESFQSEGVASLPEKLYFIGLIEWFSGIQEEVKAVVTIAIDSLPYGALITAPDAATKLTQDNKGTSLLAVIAPCLTLGEIRLNLIPEDVRINKAIKKKAKEITKMGMLAMAMLVIFCAVLFTNMLFKKIYFNKLLSSYTEENEEVQVLNEITKRTGLIKRFLDKKGGSLFVLTEIFDAMPKEVYLSSISLREDGALTLTGTAESMSGVFSLVTELENNSSFRNVKVDFTKSRRFQGEELADFGLSLFIEEQL